MEIPLCFQLRLSYWNAYKPKGVPRQVHTNTQALQHCSGRIELNHKALTEYFEGDSAQLCTGGALERSGTLRS